MGFLFCPFFFFFISILQKSCLHLNTILGRNSCLKAIQNQHSVFLTSGHLLVIGSHLLLTNVGQQAANWPGPLIQPHSTQEGLCDLTYRELGPLYFERAKSTSNGNEEIKIFLLLICLLLFAK